MIYFSILKQRHLIRKLNQSELLYKLIRLIWKVLSTDLHGDHEAMEPWKYHK